jgi:porphobilinogen synthase
LNFPAVRLRRMRRTPAIRELVAETNLKPADLVYPFFLLEGRNKLEPIASMPGIHQQSVDNALIEIDQCLKNGIKAIMLFGVPEEKDPQATGAFMEFSVVQQATRKIKETFGSDVVVMTDTCLCEYTSHGHCGIVMDGQVINDPTIDVLSLTAVSQAEAGADMVCPSDMMDGRVQSIRWALDDAGYSDVAILAYAVKYASALYAPFRDAAESAPAFGDRRSYQMDPRNAREALLEIEQDILEGADMLMVKPALGYLDILQQVRQETALPLVAYNVSGEYSMVKAAAQNGWIDEKKVVTELLTGIKRAGADLIVTYHARDAAGWLHSLQ